MTRERADAGTRTVAGAFALEDALLNGQAVFISGADQSQYNGTFPITVLDANRFTYLVPGAPLTPASGPITLQPYTFSRSGSTAIVWLPGILLCTSIGTWAPFSAISAALIRISRWSTGFGVP